MSTCRARGPNLRLLLALVWAFASWAAWPSAAWAAGGSHCMGAATSGAIAGREAMTHAHPTGAGPRLAGPDSCSHCPDGGCSTTLHCVAGTAAALLSAPPAVVLAPTDRLAEGWLADRPLSRNPTPPTPPPPSVL